jgi:hypothetical protein
MEAEKKKEDYKKGYFEYRHRWDERNKQTAASNPHQQEEHPEVETVESLSSKLKVSPNS